MRVIVTVLGKDKPGIIAKVSGALAAANANILDLTQTVLQKEVFCMTMLVDMEKATASFEVLKQALDTCGQELGMDIKLQREEIFDTMYRV